MNTALVPVKGLGEGKSRLLGALAPDDPQRDQRARDALTLAMLRDVLEAISEVRAIERVAVVTPDAHVAREARDAGAVALRVLEPGLNHGLDVARRELCEKDDALLVLLGDVAGARGADLIQLFDALQNLGGRGVVLARAHDGGTAALLRAPADCIPNGFGANSAARHAAAAHAAGLPLVELPLPSLRLDLDRREDLETLLRDPACGPAVRTRALLGALGIGADARARTHA